MRRASLSPPDNNVAFGAHDSPIFLKMNPSFASVKCEPECPKFPKQATVNSATYNLANCIIGGCVVTFPYALKSSGLILGILLTFVVSFVSGYTINLLSKATEAYGLTTYHEIAERIWGKWGYYCAHLVYVAYTLGACLGYAVILSNLVPDIFDNIYPGSILTNRPFSIFLLGFLVLFPLSLIRDINQFRHTSLLSLICVGFTSLAVFYRFLERGISDDVEYVAKTDTGLALALPLISISFTCHYNVPAIYNSLAAPALLKPVIVRGILLSLFAYLFMGVNGYLLFGEAVEGSVMDSFAATDTLMLLARAGLAVTICCTFPLILFGPRRSILELLSRFLHPPPADTCSSPRTASEFPPSAPPPVFLQEFERTEMQPIDYNDIVAVGPVSEPEQKRASPDSIAPQTEFSQEEGEEEPPIITSPSTARLYPPPSYNSLGELIPPVQTAAFECRAPDAKAHKPPLQLRFDRGGNYQAHFCITFSLVVVMLVLAWLIEGVEMVFSYNGILGGVLVYVYPPLFHHHAYALNADGLTSRLPQKWQTGPLCVMVTGVLLGFVSLVVTTLHLVGI
eukprot:GCRY01001466.1.p1 GENE.GCRY01001466.1~~GCRY01001466.1.p1  ORF type:complete len:567 (+),score=99.61 GCRY01001466.1:116-1816(+)